MKKTNTTYSVVIRNLDTFVLCEVKASAKELEAYTNNPKIWVYAVREI